MNTIVSIHDLWKTNRQEALQLFCQLYGKYAPLYADEIGDYNLAHFEKRFDRQNHMQPGLKDTSVWTSAVALVEDGEVTEGVVTELYQHGVGLVTYTTEQVSRAVADAAHASVIDPNNKFDVHGMEIEFEGLQWKDVVACRFLGEAMELAPGKPAPEGFVLVPIDHFQPPMSAGADYLPLQLWWRNKDGSSVLTADSYEDIAEHVTGYYQVILADLDLVEDPADLSKYVMSEPHWKTETEQLARLRMKAMVHAPELG